MQKNKIENVGKYEKIWSEKMRGKMRYE